MSILSVAEQNALEEVFDEDYLQKSFNEWVEMMEHEYRAIEGYLI